MVTYRKSGDVHVSEARNPHNFTQCFLPRSEIMVFDPSVQPQVPGLDDDHILYIILVQFCVSEINFSGRGSQLASDKEKKNVLVVIQMFSVRQKKCNDGNNSGRVKGFSTETHHHRFIQHHHRHLKQRKRRARTNSGLHRNRTSTSKADD